MRSAKCHHLASLVCTGLLAAALASAQDRLHRLQQSFDAEANPVRKAHQLPRLGDMQLNLLRTQIQAGDYDGAAETLLSYRDNVRSAHEALRASGIDAERRPRGFRHMEIHLRGALRTLQDSIARVPFERREEFEVIRGELSAIQEDVVKMLFPRRPGRRDTDGVYMEK